MRILLVLLLLGFTVPISAQPAHFISVEGPYLMKEGRPYYFMGANLWYGMFLGSEGPGGDRARLIRELDRLQALGIDNLRVMAGSEGPAGEPWRVHPALQNRPGKFDKNLLRGLDFLLVEMKKRDMTAVLVLNNFFQWSGGMAQYVSWATGKKVPYPHEEGNTWDAFQKFSAGFYAEKKAQEIFRTFIKKLIGRRNSISGVKYLDDPTIMSWQLANEPRGFGQGEHYIRWADETAGFIKSLDPHHLVSLGGEGKTSSDHAGTDFERVSKSAHLDYLTAHLWVENWSWYDPLEPETFEPAIGHALAYLRDHVAVAKTMNKPLVIEEFGISRDLRDYHPDASIHTRDRFYRTFFEAVYSYSCEKTPLMGCNFWSWSGEGRPVNPGDFWKTGDPMTGDPPHESQGWYSIYEKDESTLEIIKTYGDKLRQLSNQTSNR